MSRRNRNNRYNSRNRNKWDEGYDDEYFDDDDQLESEDDDSSEDQDEYEDEEYEEYDSEEEDDESDDEQYEDEEYDEDDEEEYDEDESEDEEEYDEDDEEEYDEDESDEEEVDEEDEEEEEESDDDEDDELDSEIEAAAESTAKKTIGNSDLLSKLRGQMRPQLKEDSSESNKDVEINVSPLSLFGQPISQNNKKSNTSSAMPQHANARIVQTATVGSKQPQSAPSASVQKSGSGRVITAQSQNGASVTSVQPRDLEAEKAEADKKQKEKERLEQEQKTKEEKSARILDKFKRKKSSGESAVSKTKAGASWVWSKMSSGAAWIGAGIAACFVWMFWSKPKQAWQTWRIFNASWWSGLGSGAWNAVKKPFVKKPVETAQTEGAEAVPSGSADASVSAVTSEPATVRKRKSRKKNVDIWDADATPGAEAGTDAFASKEPDSRRRLYFSLSSIGAAAIMFLLVLPSMLNGSKKSDENAVALNGQETVSDVTNQDVNKPVSETVPASENGLENNNQGIVNNNETSRVRAFNSPNGDVQTGYPAGRTPSTNGNNFNSPRGDSRMGYQAGGAPSTNGNNFNSPRGDSRTGYPAGNAPMTNGNNFNSPRGDSRTGYPAGNAPSNYNATSYDPRSTRQSPTAPLEIDAPEVTTPEIAAPEVSDLGLDAPELPSPEATAPEVTDLGLDDSEPSVPELTTPEVTDLGLDDMELPAPEDTASEVTAPEVTDLGLDDSLPTPELPSDDEVPVPDLSDSELEAPAVDIEVPEIPDETTQAGEDPLNDAAPEVPDLDNSEVTAPEETDIAPTPDLTSSVEPSSDADLPTPETDVPELSMPELSDPQPVDSNLEETPTVPEPDALETGIASQLTEPEPIPETPLTPEESLPNDSQLAASPTETSPADSSVELGAPGPLVSSANENAADVQTQTAANVSPSAVNNEPLTNSGYGTSEYNNSYANNYNNVPEYSPTYVNTGSYTVQPNDSFWTIAKRVYGSGEYARALAQYNSSLVSPQSLTVSVQIKTPPVETLERQFPGLCPSRGLASSAASTANAAPAGTRVYIVDQEESVMEIARRELGSILYCSQVYALNQEQLSGSVDRVKPGVRLLLPVQK
ncbi:MAG: LysM peptidoglycan-binding domain-containing protein [Thermoguttaceae bacterium]|nr:LysM peptidoglycan-binding domain-containing protein [Thermoguttaceae bacterium]